MRPATAGVLPEHERREMAPRAILATARPEEAPAADRAGDRSEGSSGGRKRVTEEAPMTAGWAARQPQSAPRP